MNTSQYIAADLDRCRAAGHRFQTVWSDKTPRKVSLMCRTCTDASPGKSVYVAYGDDTKAQGLWRSRRKEFDEHAEPEREEII